MPEVGRIDHLVHQDTNWAVLTHFEFVPDHREFGFQVFLPDEGIHHPVRFQVQGPIQVVLCCVKGLKVIRPVIIGRPVWPGTPGSELFGDVRVFGRTLEDHVLQQVGHSLLPVTLMTRTHQIGNIHSDGLGGIIRKKQDFEPVIQLILRNAFYRSGLSDLTEYRNPRT